MFFNRARLSTRLNADEFRDLMRYFSAKQRNSYLQCSVKTFHAAAR